MGGPAGTGRRPQTKCPHCGKNEGPGNYTRYHGDNCKQNPDYVPDLKYRVTYIDGSIKEFTSLVEITNDHIDGAFELTKTNIHKIYSNPDWQGSEKYGIITVEKI